MGNSILEIKLTKRQREIVKKMQDGWGLFVGLSESGRVYQHVSKGYENDYFNVSVWNALRANGLIDQEQSHPFNWELTKLGESIK